ncbi:MAG: hypothetical protein Q4B52_00570 [Tissierellia bacterium]|nr:hypothetical protein [Tissierellia bacterium]
MKVLIVNGQENTDKSVFSCKLAKYLSKDNKVLITSLKRDDKNIEDVFCVDDMITYDITDYFLNYANLNKIIVKHDGIDIILSPLLEDKYKIKKDDIEKLLNQLDYDFVIVQNAKKEFFDSAKSVYIINGKDFTIDQSDYFFLDNVDDDFDDREFDFLRANHSKYLGFVKNNDYDEIIKRFLNDETKAIGKLSFFEKLKKKLGK